MQDHVYRILFIYKIMSKSLKLLIQISKLLLFQ